MGRNWKSVKFYKNSYGRRQKYLLPIVYFFDRYLLPITKGKHGSVLKFRKNIIYITYSSFSRKKKKTYSN